jgi:hypothetical protein
MNWKIGLFLLCLAAARPAQAQDARQTLALANSLAAEENWDAALYYYQRVLFFSKEELSPQAWLQIARANKALGRGKDAIDCLDAAYFSSGQPAFQKEVVFEKVLFLLQSRRFYEAQAELFFLSASDLSEEEARKKTLYLAVAHLGAGNMEEAQGQFISLLDPADEAARQELEDLFSKFKTRKPKVARTLSAILPGAGQLYAGDHKAALNSFLLTGGILGLGVLTAADYTLLEATWTLPWFWRYYQGGIREAGLAAGRWNARRKARLYKEVIESIEIY